jgi:poly(3-hydroxybutyrate) depolymerase
MTWVKRGLLALLLVAVIAAAGFVIWANMASGPMPEAAAALRTDARVQIEPHYKNWLVFEPGAQEPRGGLILYPGGRVDPRSYAPAAHAIAAQGYLVVITPMPLNLAVFGANKASEVMADFPQIHRWAVGGHSLGGAMAASFVYSHPNTVEGLVLWASYPANNNSLADRKIKVASISGTRDGLATPDKIAASRTLLPADTVWTPIAGGDHAQFGWYGPQAGDNPATISRAAQQEQIVAATVALMDSLPK